ncbi:hypothetical protein LEP1GSC126_0042 [Leptospira kirschneri str. 200801774]|uniref:hypothetical protein n=1 Tax=Leptospira kirschneri TaxID=29507 RepID=UPI0002BD40BE|nr:hypothetical protein [Leptospira kirschneri]EMO78540.1 hypothetical protein LEP1GSC126_0042 [Leptospira kirschneri str. 200801774]
MTELLHQAINAAGIIGGLAIATATKYLYELWTEWMKTKKDRGKIQRELNRNTSVQEHLAVLRDHYNASRAKVFLFHNGEYYHNGRGVEKFSLTNIVVRTGMAYPYKFKEFYTQQPISQSLEIIKPICESDSFFLSTDSLPESSAWKDVFRFNEIKAHLFAKIEYNGKIEGFLSVSWHDDSDIIHDPKEIIETAGDIGILLRRKL